MELLRESYGKYRIFLTTDLHEVTKDGRHRIMADIMAEYDIGVDHMMHIATLKFAPHRQLPLSLSGMANRNPDKVAEVARACLDEWEAIKTSDGHSTFVRDVFANDALVAELEAFAHMKDRSETLPLSSLLDEMDLVRYNELSVEGLHRTGAVVAKGAPRHGPAFVSNALRNT